MRIGQEKKRGRVCKRNNPLLGVKKAEDAKDEGSIHRLGRPSAEGNGNPLQYSCLENPLDRGTWQATVRPVAKSRTWLSDWAHTHRKLKTTGKGEYGRKMERCSSCGCCYRERILWVEAGVEGAKCYPFRQR